MMSNAATVNGSCHGFEPVNIFELQTATPVIDSGCAQSRLMVSGEDAGFTVRGQVLDYQFRVGKYYLLLANLNSGYDSSIEISLLNSRYELIAEHSLDQLESSMKLLQIDPVTNTSCDILISNGHVYRLHVKRRLISVLLPFLPLLHISRR